MSSAIRYDSFLVYHLAAELQRELAGGPVAAVQFDSADQRVVIDVNDTRLVWQLHATKGDVTRRVPLYPLSDSAILPRRARLGAVTALDDERILKLELSGARRENATFTIVIELLTNHWNAFGLDHAGKVLRVLKLRAAGRTFRRGQSYLPPPQPRPERARFRSPLNEHLSEESFLQMVEQAPRPALIETAGGVQPYPHDLWQRDARHYESLLAAFASLSGEAVGHGVIRELERRIQAARKKRERLQSELQRATSEAQVTRERADLLLAYAGSVARGVSRITLPGFDGRATDIELDPKLSAIDNAKAFYDEARKHERAIKRLPALMAEVEQDAERMTTLMERARAGALSDADLRLIADRPAARQPQMHVERLPYRRYRTSGGLEVRVGRNARSNDELTLRHSGPRDIWLHARHAGGAHVVLRWHDADVNPPQRDIIEAATLAALHSTARTSRTVPVDYTRRKYVRKPRRSPPGTVVIERAKTVFVEPDPAVEESLRV